MTTAVSVQLAKELKAAGYPQTREHSLMNHYHGESSSLYGYHDDSTSHVADCYACPDVNHLLKELPDMIKKDGLSYGFRFWMIDVTRWTRHYCCNYFVLNHGKTGQLIKEDFIIDQMPAEALGKLWLYMKKNNLL